MKKVLLGIIVILLGVVYWQYNAVQEHSHAEDVVVETDIVEDDTETTPPKEMTFLLDDLLKIDSEEALKEAFGEENVKHSVGQYPEGMGEYENSLLFPDTPNEVEFVWADDTISFSGLDEVVIHKSSSEWKTADGITIGTNLQELEQLNKKPFLFGGFGWDYAGWTNWEDGYLSTRHVFITLEYPIDVDMDKFSDLWGDIEVKSDSKLAQEANPIVSVITMSMQVE